MNSIFKKKTSLDQDLSLNCYYIGGFGTDASDALHMQVFNTKTAGVVENKK